MVLFERSFLSLPFISLIIQNNVWLHAAWKIGVQSVKSVDFDEVKILHHHLGLRLRQNKFYMIKQLERSHWNLRYRVFEKFSHHSGQACLMQTSSPPSHLISCINFTRVFLRTIW